jgi:hypothetical protein
MHKKMLFSFSLAINPISVTKGRSLRKRLTNSAMKNA